MILGTVYTMRVKSLGYYFLNYPHGVTEPKAIGGALLKILNLYSMITWTLLNSLWKMTLKTPQTLFGNLLAL
jgi:hypothetical protein